MRPQKALGWRPCRRPDSEPRGRSDRRGAKCPTAQRDRQQRHKLGSRRSARTGMLCLRRSTCRWTAAKWLPPRWRLNRLCDIGPATTAIELGGDQLGELGRDVFHRIFCRSDSSKSCSSLAAPCRSSHAWQRKMSRRSGRSVRFSTLSRMGVSARTSAGVYDTDEPARDHLGLALLVAPPPLLRPPPLLPDEEYDGE